MGLETIKFGRGPPPRKVMSFFPGGIAKHLRENEQRRDLTSFLLRILTIKQNVCDIDISTRSVVQLVLCVVCEDNYTRIFSK